MNMEQGEPNSNLVAVAAAIVLVAVVAGLCWYFWPADMIVYWR